MMRNSISVVSVVASSFCSPFSRGGAFRNPFRFFFVWLLLIGCSNPLEDEILETDDPGGRRVKPEVSTVVLVDAVTNADIGELTNNSWLKADRINIRAESNAASVVFQLTGAETHKQIENEKPFALKGDNSGTYNEWIPKAGDYTLTITPYSSSGGKGQAGSPKTVKFRVGENSNPQSPVSSTPNPDLYFAGNFENATVDRTKIRGWSALDAFVEQGFAWNGSTAHVDARIHTHEGRKVLYAEVIDDDPTAGGTSRFQWSLYMNTKRLEVFHLQYRLFLSPDIAELNNYPGLINWFSVFEMWNEGFMSGGEMGGSARWNLNIHKDQTGKLYWEWITEYMQPESLKFKYMFPAQKNRTAEIPLGRWFTLDIYFNRNGKTIVRVDDRVLFDFVGQNIYPGRPELYPGVDAPQLGCWSAVNAFKLYTSDAILDWMRPRGKKIYGMYDEFKWYKE
jgi:hypothetical protein